MARAIDRLDPSLVSVDTAVVPALELLPQRLALVLRETVRDRLETFRLPAGRLWDSAILAAPKAAWTIDADAIGSSQVRNVGWIYRRLRGSGRCLPPDDGRPTLLIATGGGGANSDGGGLIREIEAIVCAVRHTCPIPVKVVQAIAPRAPLHACVAGTDLQIDVGSQLNSAFAEADVIISTSGYNSVLEIAATDRPALLTAIPRTYDDQAARARTWADTLGLEHLAGEAERSAAWISNCIVGRHRRPPLQIGANGCLGAAQCLAELASSDEHSGRTRNLFLKRYHGRHQMAGLAVGRSRLLFAAGVPTVPSRVMTSCVIGSASIAGATAFEELSARASRDRPISLRWLASFSTEVMRVLARHHAASASGMGARSYSPWARIDPRLDDRHIAAILGRRRSQRIRRLVTQLKSNSVDRTSGQCLVHGDFHLRQIIRPRNWNDFVVVDHDDMALGPAECDIGNCIAHAVTSEEVCGREIAATFEKLLTNFAAGYAKASGAEPDPIVIRYFAAIALIRRVLKRAERGDTCAFDGIIDLATELVRRDATAAAAQNRSISRPIATAEA